MKKVSDKEELLKVVDENGNYTGRMEKRSIVHKDRLFHNEVALWIIDKENKKVLLQRRSPNKKQNPNKLALCAGHIVENETIDEALRKEAQEEIGINIDNYEVKELATIKRTEPQNYCFSHHFYILEKIPLDNLTIQKEELSEVVYVDYNQLKRLVMTNSDEVVFKWNNSYQKIFELLDKIIL